MEQDFVAQGGKTVRRSSFNRVWSLCRTSPRQLIIIAPFWHLVASIASVIESSKPSSPYKMRSSAYLSAMTVNRPGRDPPAAILVQ
jgi:hypothetical protein